jgi:hypothetical protein
MRIKQNLIIIFIVLVTGISCDNYTHNTITNTNPINLVNIELLESYGETGNKLGKSIAIDTNDRFWITGSTNSLGYGRNNVSLLKIDKSGTLLNHYFYGGPGDDNGEEVLVHSDSIIYIVGVTSSFDVETGRKYDPATFPSNYEFMEYNCYLIKTTLDGITYWEKPYGTSQLDEEAIDAVIQSDGIVMCGNSSDREFGIGGNLGVLLIKTDFYGEISWEKKHGLDYYARSYSMMETKNKELIIGGISKENRNTLGAAYLLKVSSSGNLIWEKTFSKPDFERIIYSCVEANNGYVACGSSKAYDGNNIINSGIYIIKVNSNGDILWEYTYSQDNLSEGKSIVVLDDGTFLIASNNVADCKIAVTKIDENGIFMWSQADVKGSGECIIPFENSFLITGSSDNTKPLIPAEVLFMKFSEDKTNLEF